MAARDAGIASNLGHYACGIAYRLYDWDPPASVPVLRELTADCMDYVKRYSPDTSLRVQVAMLTALRAELDDKEALPQYCLWVRDAAPKYRGYESVIMLRPLWVHREDPVVQATVRSMFSDLESPWGLRARQSAGKDDGDLVPTPLLQFQSFREFVLRGLGDRRRAGRAFWQDGRLQLWDDPGGQRSSPAADLDGNAPKPGEERSYRVCDLFAGALSALEGFRPVQLYWPEARRDEACAAARALMLEYGTTWEWQQKAPRRAYGFPFPPYAPRGFTWYPSDEPPGG